MIKNFRRHVVLATGISGLLLLCACDSIIFNGPTNTTPGGPQLSRDEFSTEMMTAEAQTDALATISRQYWGHGDSPMQVTVTYDPHSPSNTAMKASQEAARIAGILRAKGVRQIDSQIMPVIDSGDVSKTQIAYDSLNAHKPAGCDEVIDMEFADQYKSTDYKLGCSIGAYTAQQVARPKDLAGNDNMDNGVGREVHNSLETYMAGQPQTELNGERASD